ncbi:phage tail protein [Klebsiella pneumoniae]|nr:phage tail protein [Klebsiella pneumoniae]WGY19604.1 phage tail protein [Klebsiella pneumoniae]
MSALFERAQKTVVMITSVPVTSAELDTATWLNLSCTIKQASFTAGQKNDIDVTTLCSDETESMVTPVFATPILTTSWLA